MNVFPPKPRIKDGQIVESTELQEATTIVRKPCWCATLAYRWRVEIRLQECTDPAKEADRNIATP